MPRLFAYEYHVNSADVVVIANNVVEADELLRQHMTERNWPVLIVPTARFYELGSGILYSNLSTAPPQTEPLLPAIVRPVEISSTTLDENRRPSDTLTQIRNVLGLLSSKYDRRKGNEDGEVQVGSGTGSN